MFSNKENINILTALLVSHGVERAVVCPGSRNAPIVHNLSQVLTCTPMTDERSAGFYALGMALATRKPVVVCVTSGTAMLNLAPAVAEAYYQRVPLVVVSADRPSQWIDQLDGQTLPQAGALAPFVRHSVSLPEPADDEQRWHCNRLINEALCLCTHRTACPVHINVPISEPLFDFSVGKLPVERVFCIDRPSHAQLDISALAEQLTKVKRVMMVVGCTHEHVFDAELLDALSRKFVVLYEPLMADSQKAIPFDEFLAELSGQAEELFPDLIIYMGGTIVSKRLRHFLRQSGAPTWFVTTDARHISDPTMHAERILECDDATDVRGLIEAMAQFYTEDIDQTYLGRWHDALAKMEERVERQSLDYSQQQIVRTFERYLAALNRPAQVHYANSSAIRLACLYAHHPVWCNRGVNGIEGCLSTAAGFSLATCEDVFCVIGDLSFLYDQNALWNDRLQGNLRILLLNNGGGGIFRKLPGLDKARNSYPFIAGQHNRTAEGICRQYGVTYLAVHDENEYEAQLCKFFNYQGHTPIVLEVFTPCEG